MTLQTLYHFTSLKHFDRIKNDGLTKGDVPTSNRDGVNAVWLRRIRAARNTDWATAAVNSLPPKSR